MLAKEGKVVAKFSLECPRCGAVNRASSFILSKKVIVCGTCKEEINVKESRLISKKCPNPNCGQIIVCDQKKLGKSKCPVCGTSMTNSATQEYSMADVICPQCTCIIGIDKTKDFQTCPICDAQIDVKAVLAIEKQKKANGISVIKYEGDNNTFVWKHPIEDFNLGSQLIVHESQEAIFMLNGEMLDTFGAGEYSLSAENLPFLRNVYMMPANGANIFHAEVYFINLTTQMAINWGTDTRVRFIEPNTGIPLDIGASGEMNIRVSDSRRLLTKLVGTTNSLNQQHILGGETQKKLLEKDNDETKKSLKGFFKAPLMMTVKTYLASVIKTKGINIFEIDEHMEEISLTLREKVDVEFKEYGLCVPQFYITKFSLPEDNNFRQLKELMASAYIGVRSAEVEASIKKAQLRVDEVEAEKKRIVAQGEADAAKIKGFSEAEVMAAQGYSQKDIIQADVSKAYAAGIGNMGGNGGSGGMVSDVLGLGIGMAVAGNLGNQINRSFNMDNSEGIRPSAQSFVKAADEWICSCGAVNKTGKFCPQCGKQKAIVWVCDSCGHEGNTGKFCSECGVPKADEWTCSSCGAVGNKGKFCAQCGKERVKKNE